MQCLIWQKWNSYFFQTVTCTYFLKKVHEVEFLILLIDIKKPAISIWNLMTPKQESKYTIYLDGDNLYGYAMSKFLPTSELKWIDPKDFDLNKYSSNSPKVCVPEVDFE